MVGDSLTVVTEIRASVEDVWRCLTAGLSAWWPEMRFEAVVGSPLDVEIELVGHGDSTSVRLTESGFSGVGTPDALPSEHEAGWRYHLARLKSASEARAVDADVS